jgi:hypothetical protein
MHAAVDRGNVIKAAHIKLQCCGQPTKIAQRDDQAKWEVGRKQ